jgi:hypothetical protein
LWGEIDLAAGIWTIPPERHKSGRGLSVILPRQARQALAVWAGEQTRAPNDLVFASGTGTPVGNWDRITKRLHERSGTSDWQRHDLRRTVATLAGRLGRPPHAIEAMLGHLIGSSLGDVNATLAHTYNRSRYEREAGEALQAVADALDRLVAGNFNAVEPHSGAELNPSALAQTAGARAKLLKTELKAQRDAAPDEYLRGDIVVPVSTVQVSGPGLFNDLLDRMYHPKALALDELDEAAQQRQTLYRQRQVPVERKLEENRRQIETASAARSKGGKNSGKTRVKTTTALDAEVSQILPTLSGSHRKQPQSAGAIQAIRDKLPEIIRNNYKSDAAISKSVGRVRGLKARTET